MIAVPTRDDAPGQEPCADLQEGPETVEPRTEGDAATDPSGTNPLAAVLKDVAALRDYAVLYLAAQQDLVRAKVRRLVLQAVMMAALAIVGGAVLLTATALLVSGLADVVGSLLEGRPALGKLLVGASVLGIAALSVKLFLIRSRRSAVQKARRKYERVHQEKPSRQHRVDSPESAAGN